MLQHRNVGPKMQMCEWIALRVCYLNCWPILVFESRDWRQESFNPMWVVQSPGQAWALQMWGKLLERSGILFSLSLSLSFFSLSSLFLLSFFSLSSLFLLFFFSLSSLFLLSFFSLSSLFLLSFFSLSSLSPSLCLSVSQSVSLSVCLSVSLVCLSRLSLSSVSLVGLFSLFSLFSLLPLSLSLCLVCENGMIQACQEHAKNGEPLFSNLLATGADMCVYARGYVYIYISKYIRIFHKCVYIYIYIYIIFLFFYTHIYIYTITYVYMYI